MRVFIFLLYSDECIVCLFVSPSVCLSISGSTDVREATESLVRGDGARCGAEDSRRSGECQKSQGRYFELINLFQTITTKSDKHLQKEQSQTTYTYSPVLAQHCITYSYINLKINRN